MGVGLRGSLRGGRVHSCGAGVGYNEAGAREAGCHHGMHTDSASDLGGCPYR